MYLDHGVLRATHADGNSSAAELPDSSLSDVSSTLSDVSSHASMEPLFTPILDHWLEDQYEADGYLGDISDNETSAGSDVPSTDDPDSPQETLVERRFVFGNSFDNVDNGPTGHTLESIVTAFGDQLQQTWVLPVPFLADFQTQVGYFYRRRRTFEEHESCSSHEFSLDSDSCESFVSS